MFDFNTAQLQQVVIYDNTETVTLLLKRYTNTNI